MAISYDISVTRGMADALADSRKRIDAAKLQAKRMAYDALAANALLDRQVAHDAYNLIEEWSGRGWVTVPCGPERTLVLSATRH